eukprot:Skav213996  [mRNA]  locus=scaffold941:11827:13344:+ [translate_table: standard]
MQLGRCRLRFECLGAPVVHDLGSRKNGLGEYGRAGPVLRAAKRQKYTGGAELVPALQEQLIHVKSLAGARCCCG